MKPGYKTTEFWITAFTVCISAMANSGLFEAASSESKTLSAIVAGLAAFGYTVGRAIVKA